MIRVLPALLLLLASSALSAPAPDYYPRQPGTTWSYSSGETQVIAAPTTVRGVPVVPVGHQYGGQTYTQDLLEYRPDGSVWLRGVKAGDRLTWYAAPLNVYPPGPLRPGQRWQSGGGTLKSSSQVVGSEPVRVPAGTFNALVIRTDLMVGGRQSTQLTSFVPGIGVVRYQTADGSRIDLLK
ncbi:hypothetical protein Dcar01_00462 [Deinococcus carri]|uniref:Uncharacterized protein n=1 Tax=Deinococcus carri TaxID=1211323 RepID=A0ABP9W317_9DEIO